MKPGKRTSRKSRGLELHGNVTFQTAVSSPSMICRSSPSCPTYIDQRGGRLTGCLTGEIKVMPPRELTGRHWLIPPRNERRPANERPPCQPISRGDRHRPADRALLQSAPLYSSQRFMACQLTRRPRQFTGGETFTLWDARKPSGWKIHEEQLPALPSQHQHLEEVKNPTASY